eukprot:3977395-Alexandrium_andersonii.AAC.1
MQNRPKGHRARAQEPRGKCHPSKEKGGERRSAEPKRRAAEQPRPPSPARAWSPRTASTTSSV